jgi:hypothetical protein
MRRASRPDYEVNASLAGMGCRRVWLHEVHVEHAGSQGPPFGPPTFQDSPCFEFTAFHLPPPETYASTLVRTIKA